VNKELPEKYFLIGDEAFTCSDQMLSPWPGKWFELCVVINLFFFTHQLFFKGRGIDRYKDAFNYWLSHSRQAVKRSFGILTQRWGIFWRPF
jgi:hypothetical protein